MEYIVSAFLMGEGVFKYQTVSSMRTRIMSVSVQQHVPVSLLNKLKKNEYTINDFLVQ